MRLDQQSHSSTAAT
jgi:hypothetical protein